MMMRATTTLGLVLVLAGCSDAKPSASVPSAGGGADTQSCNAAIEPLGSEPDEFFPDVKITACDGTKVTLDELRCKYDLMWLSVGAGWCEPCKEEAPLLQHAYEKFATEGVGVVQVLFQDASNNPATTLFCQTWVEEFDLSLPVFVDPVANTVVEFDQAQTPLNLLMDRDGKVLWSKTGKPDDIDGTIEQFLQ